MCPYSYFENKSGRTQSECENIYLHLLVLFFIVWAVVCYVLCINTVNIQCQKVKERKREAKCK